MKAATQQQANELSNTLKHKIYTKDIDGNDLIITISLDDDCKNGHQDFSMTADCYAKGKQHIDRNYLYGGCAHDEIVKVKPELQIFVDLHLCNYDGIPMHAVSNMHYHLRNGFNRENAGTPKFKAAYCKYYRITPEQFDELNQCENDLRLAIKLDQLGILENWKQQAKTGIEMLENWTGKKFLNDSKESHYEKATPEQIAEEKRKEDEGYYTPEKIEARNQERKAAAIQKIRDDLRKRLDEEIKKATDEYNVQIAVLDAGMSLDNFIYYNHTNEGCFNWRTSSFTPEVTAQEFEVFMQRINIAGLPEGIKFKLK